jgi:hypothetical protein
MIQVTQSANYQILIEGALDPNWSASLGGLTISVCRSPGEPVVTLLTGQLVDQSALQGVLDALFMLHLRLLRVECTPLER